MSLSYPRGKREDTLIRESMNQCDTLAGLDRLRYQIHGFSGLYTSTGAQEAGTRKGCFDPLFSQ